MLGATGTFSVRGVGAEIQPTVHVILEGEARACAGSSRPGDGVALRAGHFEFVLSSTLSYSDLELYQQGLLSPEEVGPLFHVAAPHDYQPPTHNGGPWANDSYCANVAYQGTRVDFTIEDVIAARDLGTMDTALSR